MLDRISKLKLYENFTITYVGTLYEGQDIGIFCDAYKEFINKYPNAAGFPWVIIDGEEVGGLVESAIPNIPVVNIGTRQKGRIRSTNVFDVSYKKSDIIKGIKKAFLYDPSDQNGEISTVTN